MPRHPVFRTASQTPHSDGGRGDTSEQEQDTHGNLQQFLLHLIARGLLAPQAAIQTDEIISDFSATKRARFTHHQPPSTPNHLAQSVIPSLLPSLPLDLRPNGGSNDTAQTRMRAATPTPVFTADANCSSNTPGSKEGELPWRGDRAARVKMRNKGIECKEEDCTMEAMYGPDRGEPMYCDDHKRDDDVDLEDARCTGDAACNRKRTFNFRGQHPMFCIKHKEKGMVNLVVRRCAQPSCTKVPCYGMQGQRAERCVEHKLSGMVNVASRRCRDPECTRLAHYNFSEQKSKLTCVVHKSEGMVNLSNKRCKHDGCQRWPYYEFLGNPPKWCSYHKADGMIDVKNRRCQFQSCQHFATYGYDTGRAKFCLSHKESGMKCLLKKQCEFEDCVRPAQYAMSGERARFCDTHKSANMVIVRLKRNRATRVDSTVSSPSQRSEDTASPSASSSNAESVPLPASGVVSARRSEDQQEAQEGNRMTWGRNSAFVTGPEGDEDAYSAFGKKSNPSATAADGTGQQASSEMPAGACDVVERDVDVNADHESGGQGHGQSSNTLQGASVSSKSMQERDGARASASNKQNGNRLSIRQELHQIAPQPPRPPSLPLPSLLQSAGALPALSGVQATGGLHMAALLQQTSGVVIPMSMQRFGGGALPGVSLQGNFGNGIRGASSSFSASGIPSMPKDATGRVGVDKPSAPSASAVGDDRTDRMM